MLVLALVLAVAGLANAGFSFDAAAPGALKIMGDYNASPFYMAISINGGAAGDIIAGAGAPNLTGFVTNAAEGGVTGIPGDAQVWTIASGLVTQPILINVNLLTVNYTGTVTVKLFSINDQDFSAAPIEGGTWTNIPEPMTMALLALGGLFIRRK